MIIEEKSYLWISTVMIWRVQQKKEYKPRRVMATPVNLESTRVAADKLEILGLAEL